MKLRRTLPIVLTLSLVFVFAVPIGATPLPWLDFGSFFKWDPAGKLYTDLSARVQSIAYKDYTFSPPSVDLILGSPVYLDISFDGDNSNDSFEIGGWLTASIDIVSNNFNPVTADPNPFIAYLDNVTPIPGGNIGVIESRWWNEFYPTMDPNEQHNAELRLSFSGANQIPNTNTYLINGAGKITPTPEPATMLLLGTGLVGLAGFGRKKFKRK